MRKNFIYVGIFLFLLGLLVAVQAFQANVTSGTVPVSKLLQLSANSLSSLQETLNQSGVIVFWFNSSRNINVFLANSTAFDMIRTASLRNISAAAAAHNLTLTGNSIYMIYLNTRTGTYPYMNQNQTLVSASDYLSNSILLQSGTYYVIFQNTGNATANVSTTQVTLSLSQLKSTSTSLFEYAGASMVLLIAGIISIIIGFIVKGKPKESERIDTEAQKEYDRIEKQGSKKKKK